MSADLALQKALLARLGGDPDLIALVPADAMLDAYGVPARFPCLIFGEGQVVREPLTLAGGHRRVFSTLHVWTKSMPAARAIVGAITPAVEREALILDGGHHAISTVIAGARFLRDPDGETAHGMVTVEALLEVAP